MATRNAAPAPRNKSINCRGVNSCSSPVSARVYRPQNWETKFGCWAAVSLTVLEIKRLLLLTLEMLVNSRAIRFAGALMPIIFTFVDVGLGFPVAIAAVYAIRKYVRVCLYIHLLNSICLAIRDNEIYSGTKCDPVNQI